MHIMVVGNFPDKEKFISNLQRHRHSVFVATNADSALTLVDETEGSFSIVFVHQGPSAQWMGTELAVGLRDRCYQIPIVFVIEGEEDDIRILELQLEFKEYGINLYTIHAPLHFGFIADELRHSGVVLINN